MGLALCFIAVTALYGWDLVRKNRQILDLQERITSLENDRPLKVEDTVARQLGLRQDR